MKVVLPHNADLTNVDLSGASEFHSEFGHEGQKVDVDLSGASEFIGDIDSDEIDVDLSGNSNIKGYMSADELDLDMGGASDATFRGQVTTLKLDLSGASNIKRTVNGTRYGFICDRCEGVMSGGSNAYIHCDDSIKVSLSDSSELYYTGDASTSGGDCTGGSNIVHDVL